MICKKIVLADLASPLGDAAQFSVCEDLLNIVAAMTVELIQIGGTDAVSIAYAVCDAHPALEGRYGQEYIALRHSREMTLLCSRNLTQQPAFGGDDIAFPTFGLRMKARCLEWVTLSEQNWVILAERRGLHLSVNSC
jgi:hypothetical protein